MAASMPYLDPIRIEVTLPKTGGPGGGGPRDFGPVGHGGGGGDDDGSSRRGPSGPSLGMLGMLALLFAISTLFGALVVAYMARSSTPLYWTQMVLPKSLWVSTAMILASSATLQWARVRFRRLESERYVLGLKATLALGLGFVLSQAMAFYSLAGQGVYLRGNPRSSLFYLVTGAHGLHLLGGLASMVYLIFRTSRTPNLRNGFRDHLNILNVSSVYWQFLTVLWIALFAVLVLWK